MAFDLNSITTGCGTRAPRVLLTGVEKIGKSTCAAGADRPIFLPIAGEEGIDDLKVPQFPTCNTFAQVMEGVKTVWENSEHFGTLAIDSVSTLEPLIWANTCIRCPMKDGSTPPGIEQVGGGYAKGYIEALDDWRMLTASLDSLRTHKNIASILIGHVRVKRFDDPTGLSYDQYQLDLHDKAANMLYRWADLILFCNTKVAVTQADAGFGKKKNTGVDISGGQRYMYTHRRPAHPGGGRGVYGRLPYELPLSWQSLMDAVAAQLAKEGGAQQA